MLHWKIQNRQIYEKYEFRKLRLKKLNMIVARKLHDSIQTNAEKWNTRKTAFQDVTLFILHQNRFFLNILP